MKFRRFSPPSRRTSITAYSCVYPIKVNQQRQVVEEVLDFGRPYRFGLEAGSKPELLAVVALADNDTPIICNGFKDAEFIETAMLALKIGRNIIPVVENIHRTGPHPRNLEDRRSAANRYAHAVNWPRQRSLAVVRGFRSKFGLTVTEIMRPRRTEGAGHAGLPQAAHFHLGSQITNIRIVKGRRSGARVHGARAARRRAAIPGCGGLGADYDGSQTNFESSMNYTLEDRQRRRLPHSDGVRRGGRSPSRPIV